MLLLDRSLMKSTNGNYQVDIRTKEVNMRKNNNKVNSIETGIIDFSHLLS